MRMIYNAVGLLGEACGFKKFAYHMYLEGFRHDNR